MTYADAERIRSHLAENVTALPGLAPVRPDWIKPYVWRPAREIPPRRFLYGQHLIRGFVSATFAPGGGGKSALACVEALAMASGKPLLGVLPAERARVWLLNIEDPLEETERRIAAASAHYGLTSEDLNDWLFVGSGRDAELVIAEQTRDGATINVPQVEAVRKALADNRIDVAFIDPFVSSHRVTENDNGAIDRVVKTWAKLADEANCSVELIHHTRKRAGPDAEVSVEDGRGAVALLAAARSARVLNPMTEDEAARAGVEKRRAYFRVDNGKANLAPPPDGSTWFRFVGVDLGNATALTPADNVGVVVAWAWPDHLDGINADDLLKVQQAVAAGRWRENQQAKDWVGHAVAEALRIDAGSKPGKAKIRSLLKMWFASGALAVVTGMDEKRNQRSFVEVGEWVSVTPETFQ